MEEWYLLVTPWEILPHTHAALGSNFLELQWPLALQLVEAGVHPFNQQLQFAKVYTLHILLNMVYSNLCSHL